MEMRKIIDEYLLEFLTDLYDAVISQVPNFIRNAEDEALAKTQIAAFYNSLMAVADGANNTAELFMGIAPMMTQAEFIIKGMIPNDDELQGVMLEEMNGVRETIKQELLALEGGTQ